jgi:hypothetical protein
MSPGVGPTCRHRLLVQFHHLGEPLQQQCPCLLDGGLYDLSRYAGERPYLVATATSRWAV